MSKKLVIVESPSKASTIKKYLGKGYSVVASMGHIIDLPKSQLGIDVENDFEPRKGGFLGKFIALLLGVILGIAATLGGIVGAGYIFINKLIVCFKSHIDPAFSKDHCGNSILNIQIIPHLNAICNLAFLVIRHILNQRHN